MRRLPGLLALLALGAIPFLHGCGSNGSSPPTTPARQGALQLTIRWPDTAPASRLIPAASQSITVTVAVAGTTVASQTVARPPAGQNTSTVTFSSLPPTAVTVTAAAYPTTNGTGTAQASGTEQVTITSGVPTTITLLLGSTITQMGISPSSPSVAVSGTVTLQASPRDASGNLVLVAASALQWSSNGAAATVDSASGIVTGHSAGSATMTVKDTESSKTGSVTVTVSGGTGGGTGGSGGLQSGSPWPMFHHDPAHLGRGSGSGATGVLKWKFTTAGPAYSSPAIGANGTVYVGGDYFKLYAVSPGGFLKWTFTFTTATSVESSPAIAADGTVYVGSTDDNLYAINPDGSLKWKFTTGGLVDSSPAIGADGTVYVGSFDTNLYAINADGSLKWKITTGDSVSSSPAIGADSTVYIGSNDHNLYAIR